MASQFEAMAAESFPTEVNGILETEFIRRRTRRCCLFWNFGCQSDWERIPKSDGDEQKSIKQSWFGKRIEALKDQMKKWPRLMAFLRRFNNASSYGSKTIKFRYDPLSYARNFDEGPTTSGEDIDEVKVRSFSLRYARGD